MNTQTLVLFALTFDICCEVNICQMTVLTQPSYSANPAQSSDLAHASKYEMHVTDPRVNPRRSHFTLKLLDFTVHASIVCWPPVGPKDIK